MRCLKCGKVLPFINKFCTGCGAEVTPQQRKYAKILMILMLTLSFVFLAFLGLSIYAQSAKWAKQDQHFFNTASIISFAALAVFLVIYWGVEYVRYIIRNRTKGLISLIIILFLIILIGGSYLLAR